LKDLTKCCAKQIKEDETGILTQRYDAQCDKFALGMDMATITYCVIETVLPGMGNAFITRSYDGKIS
jgi:hypothetical protein